MKTVKPPRLPDTHPDRQIELEEAMEAAVTSIMDAAARAGWHQAEIAAAVVSLAVNYLLKLEANAETERQISEARKRISH